MSAVSAATRVRELFERQPVTLRLVPDQPVECVAPVQRTDRPQTLNDFVGQEPLIGAMSVWLEAAIMDGRAPGHALLSGYPGLGKTSLAAIIAHELGVTMHATTADGIGTIQGLAKWLSKINEGDVGFIDEAHDMTPRVQLSLGLAMEDGRMVLPAKSGAQSEEVVIEVPPFTLVCATSEPAKLSKALRRRFQFKGTVAFYSPDELATVLLRVAGGVGVELDADAALALGQRSRGTPAEARTLLKSARDYARAVEGSNRVTVGTVDGAMRLAGIDSLGLTEDDRAVLIAVAQYFAGGPVGLAPLVTYLRMEQDTITKIVEPLLFSLGLLRSRSNGREARKAAYRHLGIPAPVYVAE
jgi:Holliday junction DNA helicase RuvB